MECQSDVVTGNVLEQFTDAEPEKLGMSPAPGSALGEHQAVVTSSWEDVGLTIATSQVSANESVCIPNVMKGLGSGIKGLVCNQSIKGDA